MSPFRLAVLNLSRRPVPALIALISIAVSVACGGVLLRLYLLSGSRFSSLAKAGDAVVGAKAGGLEILLGSLNLEGKYPDFVPLNLYDSILRRSGVQFEDGVKAQPTQVKAVIPFLYFAKLKNFRVIGTDENFLKRPEPQDVPLFAEGKWAGAGEIVLGAEVARAEGVHLNDRVVLTPWTGDGPASPLSFTLNVSGIFAATDTAWDKAAFSNLEEARKVLDAAELGPRSIWKSRVLHYFLIYLEPSGFGATESLINRRTVAQIISVEDEKQRLENLTGTGRQLGLFMTALILLLGGLAVAAMMVTRFDAMAEQLAVLRALGYRRSEIRRWLLWEGVLLGAVACCLGGLFDVAGFPFVRSLLGNALPPAFLVKSPWFQSAPVWGVALLATLLSTVIPLIRLYGQDVHLSLKG